MKFKGTKGKWYLQDYTDAYTNIVRCNNGVHETLFIGSTTQSTNKENRANALLISKAPEMFEMLKGILEDGKRGVYLQKDDLKIIEQFLNQATEL